MIRVPDLASFITPVFLTSYDDHLEHLSDTLIGCVGADGDWMTALGYSLAATAPMIFEQYANTPLERETAYGTGHLEECAGVVEVRNLAATHAARSARSARGSRCCRH